MADINNPENSEQPNSEPSEHSETLEDIESSTATSEQPNSESETVDINLLDFPEIKTENKPYEELPNEKPFSKDAAAAGIANKVVYVFAGALLLGFALIITVVILSLNHGDTVKGVIVPALGDNLLEVIKIVGTIFSPLLAFILGYYFNKDSKN